VLFQPTRLLLLAGKVVGVSGHDGRQLLTTLVGLGVALLLAIGAVASWNLVGAGGSQGSESEVVAVRFASDKSLGMNADVARYEAQEREDAMAAMEAAGYRWLRSRAVWATIEPEPGRFDWTVWDEVVASAGRHNLKLLAVLDGSPAWAREGEDEANALAPPREARDFGAFAFAFAERYGDEVDHYQIWDEPNIAPHWGAREIDPVGYARLLREGAIQVRAADRGAIVVAAALAPTVETGGRNMSEVQFLDGLYDAKASQWFDVVAAQPYDHGLPLRSATDQSRLNWGRIGLLREVMEGHGDAGRAIWAVSFGVEGETKGEVGPGEFGDRIGQAVTQARDDWPWLGPMFWAAWDAQDVHGGFAVTREGRPLQPAFDALRELAQAPAEAWPGVYGADHESGRYEGYWRVTADGADIGQSGDRLTIPFRGTRFDLTVRRGDYRGFLLVSVDGRPANALPRDLEGRSYVVLYDPLHEAETVTVAQGLSDGSHVAEIVAERGWGQWCIVGWSAERDDQRALVWLPVALTLASVVVLGATVSISWPRRSTLLGSWRWFLGRVEGVDGRMWTALLAGGVVLLYAVVGDLPSLIALALVGAFAVLRPELALPLIALGLPFYQLGKPLLGKVFSMTEILVVLAALGWLMKWLSRGAFHRVRLQEGMKKLSFLDGGVAALVLVAVASILWAEHARPAARELRTVVFEAALFYSLFRVLVRDLREAWRVVDALIFGGVLIALVGAYQWVSGENLIAAEGVSRVRGFYGSPNNLALYLGRVLPLALAAAVWGVRGRWRWAYAVASAVMLVGVLLTYSRGAWLLGMPVALLFLAAMRGRRAVAITVVVLVIALALVALTAGGDRVALLVDAGQGTSFLRLQLWKSSIAMVRDHPILGVGLDNFLYHYRTQYVLPTAWEEFNLSHPHNIVLDFWLRLGLAGLVVIGWLLFGFLQRGSQAVARGRNGSEPAMVMAVGLMASVVYMLAHGLVDNAFFLVDLGFAFMLAMALVQVGGSQGFRAGVAVSSAGIHAEGGSGCGF
jgi:O-antigen ligase